MRQDRRAKILEISSYPPPHAGWGVRVQFVKKKLEQLGNVCQVLNIGKSRQLQSSEFIGVKNGWDYCRKVFQFCRQGYLVHMHMNGHSPKGLVLAFLAEMISLLCGRRCVLTFHGGSNQSFFPKSNKISMIPIFYVLFLIPKFIICNDDIVKKKISQYGISNRKIYSIPAFSRQYIEFEKVNIIEDVENFIKKSNPILITYIMLRPVFDVKTLLYSVKELTKDWPRIGLILMGSNTTPEDIEPDEVNNLIQDLALEQHLYWTGDLLHEQFLTILSYASVFIRTPICDGVCSSLLEALALGKPVVASENPHRPPGVLTFKAGQYVDLADKVRCALEQNTLDALPLKVPEIPDTVADEARFLLNVVQGKGVPVLDHTLWSSSAHIADD
jgi:glycosyltransferase involved in cell wall biosynthesis